jgi:integrase
MRKGEIRTLKWSQIKSGFIYLEKTKTDEARQVPINDDLERLFKEIRREQGLSSEYVFIKPVNGNEQKGREHLRLVNEPIGNFKKAFSNAVKWANIKDFTFHDLRHTFASHMIMSGATLKEVQEILGHKTMQMTMRYAHLSKEHKKKAVNLLNGLTTNHKENTCHKSVTNSVHAL